MKLARLYHWQAITSEGEFADGTLISTHRQHAYATLIAQGYQPLIVKAGHYLSPRYWKREQLGELIKQLAALLQAGLPLLEALKLVSEQHERPGWRCILRDVRTHVAQGNSLSEALHGYPHIFPVLYRSLIAVGELTGKLDICCLQLAQQQEKQSRLQQKVIKALRYPCFVLLIAMLVSMMMLLLVLPEFATLYSSFNAPLPWFTRQLLHLADLLAGYGFLGLLLISCLILGYARLRQQRPLWKTREQEWLLRLPVVSSLLRGKSLNQIFNILAMTQHAGLTLPEGLDAAATIRHPLYQAAIQQIQEQLHQGTSLYHATQHHTTLFPAPCPQLIRVGEETGALDAIFIQLAEWHERRVQQQADMLTQTLEPLLMMVVGGMVGALVIGMYLPIFQLGNVLAGA
ncbi:protein transport protein HofC [Pectobacterium punjabense]|uniref:protein transport protein HofC n=1 Tax=Pectobacterium punjabense TaxID=2108399 RepID=UPI0019696C05|nr:protein transport protein HofC [Pectobacterium punjabense]MBN3134662.1 protein transport protein HofC [Pectobacterium punjabense]MCE5381062.1 protein transport protein HofC [Pectobacterium punjabense]